MASAQPKIVCNACKEEFQFNCQLRYHIRKHHFNLTGHASQYESQKVNDVWYEKVENSDAVVEMTKASDNMILIKKVTDPTVQPTEVERKEIDVRKKYPVLYDGKSQGGGIECRICQKKCGKRQIGKHFAEEHGHLITDHCASCKAKFRNVTSCASHVCQASIQKKLKKQNDEWSVVD